MTPSQDQLRAVVLLVSIDRKLAADIVSALPDEAAAMVVRLSKEIDSLSAGQRQGLLGDCLANWLERDLEQSMTQIHDWLLPSAEKSQDRHNDSGPIPGGEGFEKYANENDAYLENLGARLDERLLALALRGASIAVREAFIRNMTLRRTRSLKRTMQLMATAKTEDILKAQQMILEHVWISKKQ